MLWEPLCLRGENYGVKTDTRGPAERLYQTNFTIFIDKDKIVRFVSNDFRNVSKDKKDELALSLTKYTDSNEAIDIAKKHLNILEKAQIIGNNKCLLSYR